MRDVLTVEEAAEYLRVPRTTLLAKARQGLIPGAKIGRLWRFSRRQLLEWLESMASSQEEDGLLTEATQEADADPENQERFTLEEPKTRPGR